MLTFSTIEEAKEYSKENHFGNYHFEKAKVKEENIILCGTDKAYEEELWGDAYQLVCDFCKKFGKEEIEEDDYSDFATDLATKIRDLVLSEYEKEQHVKFVMCGMNIRRKQA